METAQNQIDQASQPTGGKNVADEIIANADEFYLRLEHSFDAPIDLVFQAWTDPEHLAKWWGPATVDVTHCDMDMRVGGRYRTCMTSPDGEEHWTQGEYLEIDPPEKLIFTWAWEIDGDPNNTTNVTTVTIKLSELDDGQTNLVMIHTGFDTEEGRDNHNGGWSSSLECLAAMLAGSTA